MASDVKPKDISDAGGLGGGEANPLELSPKDALLGALEATLEQVKHGKLAPEMALAWAQERVQQRVPEPPSNPFADCWTPVTRAWLAKAPPPRDYLVRRPLVADEESDDENPRSAGYLPASEVAMLIAAGGVGKSTACLQLSLAIATGSPWLDNFTVPIPGRVLVALGEEDAAEAQRRIHSAALVIWPDAKTRADMERLIEERVVMLPLKGRNVALVSTDRRSGEVAEQPALEHLRGLIRDRGPFQLVILDPLSRFAGPDTEIDNSAATRFVQALESITLLPGKPAVMLAHHSTKAGRSVESDADVSNARGSSALTDGARWVSELRRQKAVTTVTLEMTKTNYTSWAPKVTLTRGKRGVLSVSTTSEKIAAAVTEPRAATSRVKKGAPTSGTKGHGTWDT
jgi:hypothetical protein